MLPNEEELTRDLSRPLLSVDVPGLAVAVCDSSDVRWSYQRGTLHAAREEPVGLNTRFNIVSITKTFTAMAVLILRDAGLLHLDTPIEEWLPEALAIRYPTEDSARITLRHLLTHTSGLPRGVREARKRLGRDLTASEVLANLDKLSLDFSPGTDRRYSNLGFALLGIIIARVSEVETRQWLTQEVLTPLKLNETSWLPEVSASLAAPHRRAGAEWRAGSPEVVDAYAPVSGLYSSISDLCRYVGFHLRAWPPRDGAPERPLRRASVRESHLAAGWQIASDRMKGLGWGILHDSRLGPIVYHDGGTPVGYSASVMFLPASDLGVVALANAEVDLERPLRAVLGAYASLHLVRRRDACDAVRALLQAAAERDVKKLQEHVAPGPDTERLGRRLREAFEKHSAGGEEPQAIPVRLLRDGTACFQVRCGRRAMELSLRQTDEGAYRVVDVCTLATRKPHSTELDG